MSRFFAVLLAATATMLGSAVAAVPAGAVTRTYWIAAVPVSWNVVPNERNAIEHEHFTPEETQLDTVVYRAYTRGWGRPLRRTAPHEQGIVGPLIRGRVGDSFVVHFRNGDTRFDRPHSMHFHGVHYRFGSDGSYIPGFSGPGADVRPGQTYTYRFTAGRDSRGIWPYHDHSPAMEPSIAGGMYGALSILGANAAPARP